MIYCSKGILSSAPPNCDFKAIPFILIRNARVPCGAHVWCSGWVQTVAQPERSLRRDHVRCSTFSALWIYLSLRHRWYALYTFEGFAAKQLPPSYPWPHIALHALLRFIHKSSSLAPRFGLVLGGSNLSIPLLTYLLSLLCNCPNCVRPLWQIKSS